MTRNRLHPASRWPLDPREASELAITTVDFIDAIRNVCGYSDQSWYRLQKLYYAALQRIDYADVAELGGEG